MTESPAANALLSIIVPSYNQGRFIADTLDSILTQGYRPIEVIVVDGASTDDTTDILADYAAKYPELRWISEPDDGPADAVNKGLAMASGVIAAIQSSDDIYYPDAFDAVMQRMLAQPDVGFLIGDYCGINADGKVLYTERLPAFSWEAYFGLALCIPQSSIFFRMDVVREVGGWNGDYYGCDLDFWLRILLHTRAMKLDQILSGWRLYAGARTHNNQNARIWDGYWRMIADNQALQQTSPRMRRLAHASRHILALKFHPTGNRWAIRWHLLLAFLQHPGFWRYQRGRDLLSLLPGARFGAALLRKMGLRRPKAASAPIGEQIMQAFAESYPNAQFVQIGSNDGEHSDPLRQSICERNWRGVLVEPVPYVFARLQQTYRGFDRRVQLANVAIAERDGEMPFYHLKQVANPEQEGLPAWYDQLGSFRREVVVKHREFIPDIEARLQETQVPCLSFDSLMQRYQMTDLDLLHLDTEGYDYILLQQIDFHHWQPVLLIYEHHHLTESEKRDCQSYLERHGYRFLEIGMDTWALRSTDSRHSQLDAAWQRLNGA